MRVRICLLVAAIATYILVWSNPGAAHALTLIDDFSADHIYYDVVEPFSNGSKTPFDVPALYMDMTGDFDVKLQMDVLPPDAGYLTLSLAAWTTDQQQAIHIDNIGLTGNHVRFRDLEGFDEYALSIGRQPWFRMTRTGDVFEGFYGSDGENWTSIGTMERDYGDTLRVGPATWNSVAQSYVGSFSYFEAAGGASDDFDSDHTYWDGSTMDTSGTVWSGAQGRSYLTSANANTSTAGELQFAHVGSAAFNADLSGTIWSGVQGEAYVNDIGADTFANDELQFMHTGTLSNGSAPPFDVPALYVDVTGDFDAKVRMDVLPEDVGYLTLALAAWTADQQNAIHIDNIGLTGNHVRFRDLDSSNFDEYSLAIDRQPWFRMTRTGDVFEGFYSSDGENWTSIGTMERDYGDTLRVGPAAWNGLGTAFAGSFSYFEITVVPEPGSVALLISVTMTLILFLRRNY